MNRNFFFVLAVLATACTRWYGYAPPAQGGASEKEKAKPAPVDKADKGKAAAEKAAAPSFTVPYLECESGDEAKCREVGQARLRQMTLRRGEDRRTYLQHQVGFDRTGCEKVGSAVRCGETWDGWMSMMDQRELAQITARRSAPAVKPVAKKKECEEPAAPASAAKAEEKPAASAAPAAPAAGNVPAPPPPGGGDAAVVEVE